MLNFRLLNILTNSRSIRIYLGILSLLGIGVLLDILLFLKLALVIGPWITMSALAVSTAGGIFSMHYLIDEKNRQLINSIDTGLYKPACFSRYLGTITASLFIIIPGFLNSLMGFVLLFPPLCTMLGNRMADIMGLEWQEAYEFLRLDRVTTNRKDLFAEG